MQSTFGLQKETMHKNLLKGIYQVWSGEGDWQLVSSPEESELSM